MSSKDKKTFRADRAWEHLYNRLDSEGLIPETAGRSSAGWFRSGRWQWAAAILLIGCSLAFFLYKQGPAGEGDNSLLTLKNEKGATTLVKTMEDGSVIYLAGNAEISYPETFDVQKREVHLNGNALFDVTGNKKRPFIIHTHYTEVEVIGTSFEIKSQDEDRFELSVLEGEVKVTFGPTPKEIFIRAGEAITISPAGECHYGTAASSDILNRMTHNIRFRNEYVKDILQVINKNHPDETLAAEPSLEKIRLTVTFAGHTIEQIAEVLSEGLNTSYKKENETFIIGN